MLSDLRTHERSVYSQGGEDGVLERIFECIGVRHRRFVEFGAWDGEHWSNTALLRKRHGWTGLLMEGDPDRTSELVRREIVTAENIEALLTRYGIPRDFDLLSIDIDGNEYWVWKALERFQPRVVVIEYNVFFGVGVSKTMPYDPSHQWDKTRFHGASLAALQKLGDDKGYALVHTDSYAPNAFFVLRSELPADWVERPLEALAAWGWDPETEPEVPSDREWQVIG